MKIILTLSPRFREWCRENPDEILARIRDKKVVAFEMDEAVFDMMRERMRNEGGSIADWLISSDDFVTDVEIVR
jgi:hypothetical protein